MTFITIQDGLARLRLTSTMVSAFDEQRHSFRLRPGMRQLLPPLVEQRDGGIVPAGRR